MKIAIVGTGNVGAALAEAWSKAGHEVHLGVRDPQHFKGKDLLSLPSVTVHAIREAVRRSDVVLLAVPPSATKAIVEAMGDVGGKVIIDATNSVRDRPEGFATVHAALRVLAPKAEVVKCFNTTGFENLKDPRYPAGPLTMFMAGDSTIGKEVADRLARDAGFGECIDFGGDAQVPLLEQLALAWINLAIRQGHGRNFGLRILRR